jgi:hypothetical protein
MVFGTNNYWATDSMQWQMNEKRAIQSKWDTGAAPSTVAEPREHQQAIFAMPAVTLQARLDRERPR